MGDARGPRRRTGGKTVKARQLKPKHELRGPASAPYCWACSVLLGEPIHPCRDEFSLLTPREQKAYYAEHQLCGRCGQPANTRRRLCRCNGKCGCAELHDYPEAEVLDGQESLFDGLPSQGKASRKDYENPG
jgi:hypothetical protein